MIPGDEGDGEAQRRHRILDSTSKSIQKKVCGARSKRNLAYCVRSKQRMTASREMYALLHLIFADTNIEEILLKK